MNPVDYFQMLRVAAPETIVAATMLVVLAADLTVWRDRSIAVRFNFGAILSLIGCSLAAVFAFAREDHFDLFNGILVMDPRTDSVKVAILGLTIFTILISTSGKFTEHVGEYLSLILLGTIGLMFLVSAEDLLMIFVALELASLALYILTAFNKRNARSSEAALKYFLFGGMSAAFLLFGFSLLYGVAGSTHLTAIASNLAGKGLDPLLVVALVMTIIGFGFKVAAVPFHLWAPDAYEGAPTPSAAFIGAGSKVASFYILAKILSVAFAGAAGSAVWHGYLAGWTPAVAVVAAFSMVLGNLTAIVQTSVKRMLAYSAIAHAGYMLLGVLSNTSESRSGLMFYVITYGLTTIGAFGVVTVVEEATGGDAVKNFAGLSRRAPLLALCLLVFLLSLGGIPPLAGFIGKFFLFTATVAAEGKNLGLLWLVILAIAMSAVSFYYYLQVLKEAYVQDAAEGAGAIEVPAITMLALVVLAALVILLGCQPSLLTQFL
ncbi:MAG TPA: NADH-quinone oxidoreductase subunit N [Candidatus Acidoferrales bacterium]|nr:NADH-quinone oxidoreductase subunit N [Candidatus Acidoferrales bacterium]